MKTSIEFPTAQTSVYVAGSVSVVQHRRPSSAAMIKQLALKRANGEFCAFRTDFLQFSIDELS